jgi:hypothetical protein
VRIQAEQIDQSLCDYTPEQPYIATLIPYVRQFILEHRRHFLFLTCDIGERPWDIGESKRFDWKEIRAAFDHDSRFLPRNLVDDYRLTSWDDVLQFYESGDAWMLHEQMADELDVLRSAFERLLQGKDDREEAETLR